MKDKDPHARSRKVSDDTLGVNGKADVPGDSTVEEQLLAALLGANAELMEALKQYDDLKRVGLERKIEDQSRRDARLGRRVRRPFLCSSYDNLR